MVIVSNSRKLCAFAIHHVIPVIFVFEHHGATVPPGHSVTFTLQVGAGLVGAEVTLELGGKSPVIMCHSIARSHTHHTRESFYGHDHLYGWIVPRRWIHDLEGAYFNDFLHMFS